MPKPKIVLASDHAGYAMKNTLTEYLLENSFNVIDYGCKTDDSCDYPDYAHPMAQAVQDGEFTVGVSLCGSGNGINMVVNKYSEIRAALCWNKEIAELARLHNDANICSIPARFVTEEEAISILKTFLNTEFEGGRHKKRIDKIPIKFFQKWVNRFSNF